MSEEARKGTTSHHFRKGKVTPTSSNLFHSFHFSSKIVLGWEKIHAERDYKIDYNKEKLLHFPGHTSVNNRMNQKGHSQKGHSIICLLKTSCSLSIWYQLCADKEPDIKTHRLSKWLLFTNVSALPTHLFILRVSCTYRCAQYTRIYEQMCT